MKKEKAYSIWNSFIILKILKMRKMRKKKFKKLKILKKIYTKSLILNFKNLKK